MNTIPMPLNEEERIATLKSYAILDSGSETAFDSIVNYLKKQFDVQMCVISLIARDRQWFKAKCGIDADGTPRDISFCTYTILGDDVLNVPDATKDERFKDNPLVAGEPHIRFYSGAPLIAPNGHKLGSICVIDNKPKHDFCADKQQMLADMASMVMDQMEIRKAAGEVALEIEQRIQAETEARTAKEEAVYIAFHDALTGLGNRAKLQDFCKINELAKIDDKPVGAFYIDINKFKYTNDSLGHSVGDALLQKFANDMRSVFGDNAFLARLGGDEFFAILAVDDENHARALGAKFIDKIKEPMSLLGHTVIGSASVGIAVSPHHGETMDDLVARADMAMYNAKQTNLDQAYMFDFELEKQTLRRVALEKELQTSLINNEIEIYFQPIVEAKKQSLYGVEALIRWNNPRLGMVMPNDFIPLAEECGFIHELGAWVLKESIAMIKDFDGLMLSVNLSPIQFKDPHLCENIKKIVLDSDIDPNRLELEITESALIHETQTVLDTIEPLRALGIHISLDDFCTGNSSLSYIKDFPLDKIKIDRSFVAQLGESQSVASVVQCLVTLASSMSMEVTAEGVETEMHETLLKFVGCQHLQGYRYGKPVPLAQLTQDFHLVDTPMLNIA